MRLNFKSVILAAVLLVIALAATGCGEVTVRETAKTAHRAAVNLRAARDLKVSLLTNQVITQAESDEITRLMQQTSAAVRVLNDRASEWQAKIDALDKADPQYAQKLKATEAEGQRTLQPFIRDALKSLRELNDRGVLHIKNKDAREALSALLDLGGLLI